MIFILFHTHYQHTHIVSSNLPSAIFIHGSYVDIVYMFGIQYIECSKYMLILIHGYNHSHLLFNLHITMLTFLIFLFISVTPTWIRTPRWSSWTLHLQIIVSGSWIQLIRVKLLPFLLLVSVRWWFCIFPIIRVVLPMRKSMRGICLQLFLLHCIWCT